MTTGRDSSTRTDLPAARRLAFYGSRFDTVEIDATFYGLPSEHAVVSWRDAVPDGFVFAVKGSRLITHFLRLADVDDALATFLDRMSVLGEKLAVVLWQLPPTFRPTRCCLHASWSVCRPAGCGTRSSSATDRGWPRRPSPCSGNTARRTST